MCLRLNGTFCYFHALLKLWFSSSSLLLSILLFIAADRAIIMTMHLPAVVVLVL